LVAILLELCLVRHMRINWQDITDLAHFLWVNNLESVDVEWFGTPSKIGFRDNSKNYYEKVLDKD